MMRSNILPVIFILLIILCAISIRSSLVSIDIVEKGEVIDAVLVGAVGTYEAKIGGEVRHFRVHYGRYRHEPNKVGDTVQFHHLEQYPEKFINTRRTASYYYWDIGICTCAILISVCMLGYLYVVVARKEKGRIS